MVLLHLSNTPASEQEAHRYKDPDVAEFNQQVIETLEQAPDGASAAAAITGLYAIRNHAHQIRETSLTTDIRRLSSDDAAKAAMLSHVSRSVGRAHDETTRLTGLIHYHQAAESAFHDLARHLEGQEQYATVGTQIREILEGIEQPAPPAVGTVVIAAFADHRWRCGWFKRSDEDKLEAHPFAGWALVATGADSVRQHTEAAFLLGGQWWTKTELTERGLSLQRMD